MVDDRNRAHEMAIAGAPHREQAAFYKVNDTDRIMHAESVKEAKEISNTTIEDINNAVGKAHLAELRAGELYDQRLALAQAVKAAERQPK